MRHPAGIRSLNLIQRIWMHCGNTTNVNDPLDAMTVKTETNDEASE